MTKRPRHGPRKSRGSHEWLLPEPALGHTELELDPAATERELGPDADIGRNVVEFVPAVEVGNTRQAEQQGRIRA